MQFPVNFVTFTEEILTGKLYFYAKIFKPSSHKNYNRFAILYYRKHSSRNLASVKCWLFHRKKKNSFPKKTSLWQVFPKSRFLIFYFDISEAYSEPSRTSKKESNAKIVNGWKLLTILAKSFVLCFK